MNVWLTITEPSTANLKVQRKWLTFRKSIRKSMIWMLFSNPFKEIIIFIIVLRENVRNKTCKLWAITDATGRESCAWLTNWRRERHRQLAHWAVICECVTVCVRGSQQLQMKLAIKLSPLAAVCSRDSRSDLLILLMRFILWSQHHTAEWGVTAAHRPLYSFPHSVILCTQTLSPLSPWSSLAGESAFTH